MNLLSDRNSVLETPDLDDRTAYFIVLILGMILSVVLFNMDYELAAAGVIIITVGLLALVKRKSSRPVFDERDLSLAKESSHMALIWSGAIGGAFMIFVSIGMGLGYMEYPEQVIPYYQTWGGIVLLAVVIEILKRYRVIK